MRQPIYMLIGCPGVGKSWVASQLKDKFEYIPHDEHINGDYLGEISKRLPSAKRPLLIETPFSVSQIKDPLEAKGHKVVPVFIHASEQVVKARYISRGKPMPAGHDARQRTYAERAKKWGAFSGTSTQVLEHLKKVKNA